MMTMTDARHTQVSGSTKLRPGTLLAGRYVIERFIASGGMGEVYEADDRMLVEPVAIKVLRRDLVDDMHAQVQFAHEIRLARRITHRNVARVFDGGVDGNRVFFTMELYPGETLKAYLARTGPLSIAQVQPIAKQILAGIAAAHEAGIVHADLKPSNMLRAPDGRIVLTDFGLARQCCAKIGCRCSMPHLTGTPAYMAPEQVTGGDLHERTDLFSFGVILFELLTGEQPWRGDTVLALAHARLEGDTPSPRALRPDLDPRWDELIRSCLQRDPADRPASADEVARALNDR